MSGPGGAPTGVVQRVVDEILLASGQQWLLGAGAAAAATAAFASASVATGGWWVPGMVVVILLAIAAAAFPETPMALVVVAVVLWQWMARVDDVDTPWLPVATICLLAFHALIALAAGVPSGGTVPGATLRRWALRAASVSVASVAMWLAVVALERRELSGNGLLTGLAVLILAASAVAIRQRSVGTTAR